MSQTMEVVLCAGKISEGKPFSINVPFYFPDDSGDEEPASQSDRTEIQGTLKILVSKLDDLSTCNDLIAKHGAALQRSLSELEGLKVPVEGGEKIKAVNERATLFRITSNAMINVSSLALTHTNEFALTRCIMRPYPNPPPNCSASSTDAVWSILTKSITSGMGTVPYRTGRLSSVSLKLHTTSAE